MNIVNIIARVTAMFLVSGTVLAHEGMHAAAQTHIGENHMGLMEVSIAVLSFILIGALALNNAKK